MRSGWEIKKLNEVLKIQNGYAFNSKLFTVEKGIPLIRIRDIKNGISTETNFNGQYDKKYEVKAGDLLIGMDGEFACYEWKGDTALLNQRVCRLQEFSDRVYSRFLFYGINKYLKAIEDDTAYATVKHISSRQIENIEIPLPALSEQKRIVELLDEAFAAIDKAKTNVEKNLQNAKELFESYLQNVFANKGEDWEEKRLSEVFEIKPSKSEARNKFSENDLVSFLPMEDLNVLAYEIKSTKEKKFKEVVGSYTYFSNEDVLLAKITPCFENGKIGIARNLTNGIGFGSSEYIVFRSKECIIPDYLYFFLSRNSFREEGSKRMTGAVGHKRVSKEFIEEYLIAFPKSIKQQQTLVTIFNRLSSQTKKIEKTYQQKLDDLEELKKSILQKAFSGELTAKEMAL